MGINGKYSLTSTEEPEEEPTEDESVNTEEGTVTEGE